ncbi:unnamed protein product [Paramecium sonneborni]|uniref:Transmembrane protein n=1 Tax=Paramecium sonneborni TaxID=65129 RepID=A0A8S1RA62_9CILI|nr:unnamed protein product [Paramecium sonneborni]
MNPFTLTFIDKNLEKKYKENYSIELIEAFRYTISLLPISNIILSIYWIQRNEILIGVLLVTISLTQTIIFYYVKMKQQFISLFGYLISTLSLLASFYHFIPLYYPDFYDHQYNWIFDISQFLALNFTLAPNFLFNQVLQLIFLFSRLLMRNYNDFHIETLIITLYLILFWQKEYYRQKHNRQLFLLNEQQKSSFSIWDDLVDDKIVLLTYNHYWEKIELQYANKSMNEYIKIENKDFLLDLKVINQKITLNQYLLERVREQPNEFQIMVLNTINRDKLIVNCVIKKFVEIKITLKFSECQSCVSYQQNNNNSYFRVLQRIKKTDKAQYYKENLRNLLYNSYYVKEKLLEQIEELKYYKLRLFLDKILNKDKIRINFEIKQFFTVLPLFFTLITCLQKVYKITDISLIELNEYNIQLILQGNDIDVPKHRFEVCKKIVNNILLQIGYNNNCTYQKNYCRLILVNQSDLMEWSPKSNQLVTFSNLI